MDGKCIAPGCDRQPLYVGPLCRGHYDQKRRTGELRPLKQYRKADRGPGNCKFPQCEKPKASVGYCSGHVAQIHRGEDLRELANAPGLGQRRFWSHVERTSDGCWPWTGRTVNSGYGMCSVEGRKWLVHRYSYTLAHGDIPEGLFIDHRCRRKLCVNPAHLRAVTHTENVRAQGLRTNNTSGVRGVSWDKSRGQWAARVRFEGKKIHIGRFNSLEGAAQAVAAKRAELYARVQSE